MRQAKRMFPPLSEMERAMLQRIRRQHSKAYLRDRAHMVVLSDQGYPQTEIAAILHTTERTVHTILSRYRQNRLAGLCRKPGSGAVPGLNSEQLDTLSQWVVQGPSLLGYSFVRWTTKTLRGEVDKRFRVPLSRERIRQLLHTLGFSWKRAKAIPDTLDEEARQQAQQRLEELLEQAAQEEILLLLEDETFVHLQEPPGYGWSRVGHPQRIPQVQGKGLVVTFGCVDPLRGRTHYRLADAINQDTTLTFVQQITRYYAKHQPGKQVVMVLDRHPGHKANQVIDFAQHTPNFRLEFLPPRSADLNPMERIWDWLKERMIKNGYMPTLQAIQQAIRRFFCWIAGIKEQVISKVTQTGKIQFV